MIDSIRAAVHSYILRTFLQGEDPDELTDETPLISEGFSTRSGP